MEVDVDWVVSDDGLLRMPNRLARAKPTCYLFEGEQVHQVEADADALPVEPVADLGALYDQLDALTDPVARAAQAEIIANEMLRGLLPDESGLESGLHGDAASGVESGEEDSDAEPEEIPGAPMVNTWTSEKRFSASGFNAYRRLTNTQALFRDLSRQVTVLNWRLDPELAVKKFPFFIKSIEPSIKSKEQELKERKKEPELFCPPVSPSQQDVAMPSVEKLPAWGKLPKQEARPIWLRELITGLWFTSISTDEADPTPDSWLLDPVADHTCCIAFDLPEDTSQRFLTDSPGQVGAFLKRYLARRLERDLGAIDMAAVWRRSSLSPATVTLFLLIRSHCGDLGKDQFTVEQEGRLHRTLVRHGIPFSARGPLREEHLEDWAPLYPKLEEDRRRRDEGEIVDDLSDLEVANYDHSSGFPAPDDLTVVGSGAYRRWERYAATCQLPFWLSASTLMLMKDVLVHADALVTERKHLADRYAKRQFWSTKWTPADKSRLDALAKLHGSLDGIRIYRGSPAQLASLIYGAGEVLGEYCQSQHKAGCAKSLYETARSAVTS